MTDGAEEVRSFLRQTFRGKQADVWVEELTPF